MEGGTPKARRGESLYGDATKETRAWAVDCIARNRETLDLMARL